MRAGWSVVAGNPIFVVRTAVIDEHRLAPMDSVGGAAGGYCFAVVVGKWKRRNQPLAVLCVISHSGVARSRETSSLVVVSEAWKIAAGPRLTAVGGGSKSYICAATVRNACDLKCA